jgi:glycosyltransferase involved in cell wall biosynthesis
LTNANPGNKFVSSQAVQLLNRAKVVLSPAHAIDSAVRSTYNWRGPIKRARFWVEDYGSKFCVAPSTYKSDFLFLARREDDKGLRDLLRATANIVSQFPDVRVMIGGTGSALEYLSLARDLGITRQTEFVELPLHEDAMRSLADTRWLVLPSYHEGYPLSLLEAARASVPFIATTVGAIEEVFGGSGACRLVPPQDAGALSLAMAECLKESANDYRSRRRAAFHRFTELSSAAAVEQSLWQVLLADAF